MRFLGLLLACAALLQAAAAWPQNLRSIYHSEVLERGYGKALFSPKVVIVSMFSPEAEVWYDIPEFDVLAINISVPGLSMLYPDVHCTADGEICQLTTGESEINAATTISSLVASPYFNFSQTYFMIAGIAGVNPEVATLGSVTFAKYAVQVALQYEFDAREMPTNFTTGYVPLGATTPGQYPTSIYGTEVFEVNEVLRDLAVAFANTADLNDSAAAVAYRANYAPALSYLAGTKEPSVVPCDVATSDVYYSGALLSEAFENTTTLLTNGSGIYCTTAQEDNASLEAFLRAAMHKRVDFSRIIVMRTTSDFDRPYPGEAASENLFWADQGGFEPAIQNIYLAGIKVVEGIIEGWEETFSKGITPTNYIGDIFGTLGGTPDFGPYSSSDSLSRRDTEAKIPMRRRVRRDVSVTMKPLLR
ncbi:purine nucleoside permease-like protein [Daedalea quercina L-15889]|uniref:Purine nucleoside permease-like protein n=1 Tax=Daedalea quercina L-15889 TaxID=1314783 RepID=A0A165NKM6_9APHY|nr:purine nucleoside permease-like protein [Daedalea quercina L-15889]